MSVYRIKPLVWDFDRVQTPIGTLCLQVTPRGSYYWYCNQHYYVSMKFKTIEKAKQDAESWFRNKLLEALEEAK